MRIALPNRITLSTNVNRKYLIKYHGMYTFIKEPVCDTDDSRQQTQAFLDSTLRTHAQAE